MKPQRHKKHRNKQAIEHKATEGTEKIHTFCYLRLLLFKILVRLSTIPRLGIATKGTRGTSFGFTLPFVLFVPYVAIPVPYECLDHRHRRVPRFVARLRM